MKQTVAVMAIILALLGIPDPVTGKKVLES